MSRIFLYLLFLIPFSAMAQLPGNSVNLIVTDENSQLLSGATVRMLRTGAVFRTIENGTVRLTIPSGGDSVVVSHIGFESVVVMLSAKKSSVTVSLPRADASLDEVVVVNTGYQSLPRERATGSFELVDENTIQSVPGTGLLDRLEGNSSLLFDRSSTRPGLTLRGLSTINGPKDILVIVDNFPFEGDIQNINPNDIASVTFLKDAAAASIWGTRAGNGVMVITTKKGGAGKKMTVAFNSNLTHTPTPNLEDLPRVNAHDFIDFEKQLFEQQYRFADTSRNNRPSFTPVYEYLFAARAGLLSQQEADADIDRLRNASVTRDFQDQMYQSGLNQQYAVSVSGGGERSDYFLSLGYDHGESNLADLNERLSARMNVGVRPLDRLTIQTSLGVVFSKDTEGREGINGFSKLYPYFTLYNDNGEANALATLYRQPFIDTFGYGRLRDWNLYPATDYRYRRNETLRNFISGNISVDYKILNVVTIRGNYQYQREGLTNTNLQTENSFFTRELTNRFAQFTPSGAVVFAVPPGDILDTRLNNMQAHQGRLLMDFSDNWGDHKLDALVGAEIRKNDHDGNTFRIYGYDDDFLTSSSVDTRNPYRHSIQGSQIYIPTGISASEKSNHFVSTFANAAYSFKERYVLSGSVRRDASNLFGVSTNDKWNPLWSLGLGWDISRESFFNSGKVQFLKLRATYGYSGNVDQGQSAVTVVQYNAFQSAVFTNYTIAAITQHGNPSLRWETVATSNIGVDFSVADGLVSGSIDVFRKRGFDLFGEAEIDITTGLGSSYPRNNVANMVGSGLDAKIEIRKKYRDFSWNGTFLINYNRNKITNYLVRTTQGASHVSDGAFVSTLEGRPVYSILSYQWRGLDGSGNPLGVLKGEASSDYASLVGAGTQVEDIVYNGPATPSFFGSVLPGITYKNWSLVSCFVFKTGYWFRRPSIDYNEMMSTYVGHADYNIRWRNPGDEERTSVPSFVYPSPANRDAFYQSSEVLATNGSHVRWQYLTLSYRASPTVSIMANATQLGLIWRSSKSVIDPEYTGVNAIVPRTSWTLGLRASF